MAVGVRPNIELAQARRPAPATAASWSTTRLQTFDPSHLRRGRVRAAPPPDLRPGGAAVGTGAHLRAAHRRDRRVAIFRSPQCHAAQGDGHRRVFGRRFLRRARRASRWCCPTSAAASTSAWFSRATGSAARCCIRRHARSGAANGADRRAGATSGRSAISCCSSAAAAESAVPGDSAYTNHLSLLRRRLRRARHAPRTDDGRGARRSGASGQPRQAVRRRAARWARRVGLDGRLLYPQVRGERVPWSAAIAHGRRASSSACIERHGPDSVAFYVSGQLLTEDYYVANKLMKGYIGSGEHRYQFAPVHVLGGGRPQARLRRGRGARSATRISSRGSGGAGRLQHRVVPSDPVAATARGARTAAAHEDRRASIRAAPPPASSPICTCRSRRAPTCSCSTGCWCGWRSTAASIAAFVGRAHPGLGRRRCRRRAPAADLSRQTARACGLDVALLRQFYRAVRGDAGQRSPRFRRA